MRHLVLVDSILLPYIYLQNLSHARRCRHSVLKLAE
jgi:hypothetical protein